VAEDFQFIGPAAPAGIDTETEWEWGDGSVDTTPGLWPEPVENQGAFEFTEWVWEQIKGDFAAISEGPEAVAERGAAREKAAGIDAGSVATGAGAAAASAFKGFFGLHPLTVLLLIVAGFVIYQRFK